VEERDVIGRDAGGGEGLDDRGGDGPLLRNVAGQRDRHAVARHDVRLQRRTGGRIGDGVGYDPGGSRIEGALGSMAIGHERRGIDREHERLGGGVIELDFSRWHPSIVPDASPPCGPAIVMTGAAAPVCAVVQLTAPPPPKLPPWIVALPPLPAMES